MTKIDRWQDVEKVSRVKSFEEEIEKTKWQLHSEYEAKQQPFHDIYESDENLRKFAKDISDARWLTKRPGYSDLIAGVFGVVGTADIAYGHFGVLNMMGILGASYMVLRTRNYLRGRRTLRSMEQNAGGKENLKKIENAVYALEFHYMHTHRK